MNSIYMKQEKWIKRAKLIVEENLKRDSYKILYYIGYIPSREPWYHDVDI